MKKEEISTDNPMKPKRQAGKTMQPNQRSEEASGGSLNTSEEVAQLLRRAEKYKAEKTEHLANKKSG